MAGVEISKRILLINSVSSILRRILNISILLWLHQHLVRHIPAEELKLLPVLMGVIAIAPILVTVLQGGLGRYLTEAYAQQDEPRVTQVVSSMSPFLWGAALLLAAAGSVFIARLDLFVNVLPEYVELSQAMFAILLAGTVLRVALQPFSMGFYMRQKMLYRDLLGTGAELFKMLLLVILLTQVSTSVLWVVVANITSTTLEFVIVVAISMRLVPALRFRVSAIRREVLKPVLTFGGWTILGQLSTLLREMADPLILNNYSTANDVVAFNLGSQPDRQIRRSVFSVTATAQPAATAMVATGQSDRLGRAWYRMTRYSLWVMMGLTLPLMVFRDEFFQLYLGLEKYAEYQDSSLVMLLLLARYIAISPNAMVGLMAIARAEMHPAAWRGIVVELTNVLLTIFLVTSLDMGAVGAAFSTLVVHGILHPALNWSLGLRLAGVGFGGWARRSIVPGLIPGLCAVPVWLALNHFVEPDVWSELGLCALAGYLVYFVVLGIILPGEDRADAVTVWGRIPRRMSMRSRSARDSAR